jgi:hypothetical protein
MIEVSGSVCAIFEFIIYILISRFTRKTNSNFMKMDTFTYYWFTFIILTGFWELVYLTNYEYTNQLSHQLINSGEHVWTKKYSLSHILPWKFSEIFYSEYGAYADREYMTTKDIWSRLIEGSHCLFCGLFCLFALITAGLKGINTKHFYVTMTFAMGCQFMNSILYMGNYQVQTFNVHSINYNTHEFPLGDFWSKRPFMYVNFPWTLFPIIIVILHLIDQNKYFRESYATLQKVISHRQNSKTPYKSLANFIKQESTKLKNIP